MPSNSQDGQQSNLFGPEVVLASPSPSPVKVPEQTTPDTSGPKCAASLASASLQLSLESKLQAALDVNGSPEYALTWKRWDMQSGQPICALRARAHRISASVSTGALSGWGTPNTMDHLPSGNLEARKKKGGCSNLKDQVTLIAGWPTPRANDAEKRGQISGDPRNGLPGLAMNGISASTEKPVEYRLNQNFSRWLMGFPAEWASCAPTVMPSSRRSRRSSS